MKIRDYLRSRISFLVTDLIGLILILLFVNAFRMGTTAVLIISAVFLLVVLLNEFRCFRMRRDFFDPLISAMQGLDKQYLIPEIIREPGTYPETLVYDILRRTGASMNEQIGAYRRKSEDYRDFLDLWTHEIKVPVSTLTLICSNYPEIGEKIGMDVNAIDRYVDNVLYYSRSEAAESDYLIREVKLSNVFLETAVKYRRVLAMKEVSLEADDLEAVVLTDDKWLSYIFNQLMDNSLKYLSPDREGEIQVYAEDLERTVVLHFRDNGIGIPESDLPYVFDKSFTGQNGRLGEKSTGFGLYIVKSLCTKLGHSISVSSRQGEYTDFTITFQKNRYLGTA